MLFSISEKVDNWRRQEGKICYGAKDDTPGRFKMFDEGLLVGVKLVHVSGHVNCNSKREGGQSRWGCGGHRYVATTITDSFRGHIFPDQSKIHQGVDVDKSKDLVFINREDPIYVSSGMELQVWYTEDLKDAAEVDNEGTHCVDVYTKVVDPLHFR